MMSMDAEKKLTEFNTHLWLKLLKKKIAEGTCLHIVKGIYDKSMANIILSGETLKVFL